MTAPANAPAAKPPTMAPRRQRTSTMLFDAAALTVLPERTGAAEAGLMAANAIAPATPRASPRCVILLMLFSFHRIVVGAAATPHPLQNARRLRSVPRTDQWPEQSARRPGFRA